MKNGLERGKRRKWGVQLGGSGGITNIRQEKTVSVTKMQGATSRTLKMGELTGCGGRIGRKS